MAIWGLDSSKIEVDLIKPGRTKTNFLFYKIDLVKILKMKKRFH